MRQRINILFMFTLLLIFLINDHVDFALSQTNDQTETTELHVRITDVDWHTSEYYSSAVTFEASIELWNPKNIAISINHRSIGSQFILHIGANITDPSIQFAFYQTTYTYTITSSIYEPGITNITAVETIHFLNISENQQIPPEGKYSFSLTDPISTSNDELSLIFYNCNIEINGMGHKINYDPVPSNWGETKSVSTSQFELLFIVTPLFAISITWLIKKRKLNDKFN